MMFQEKDFILRQIEELGRVLGKILSDLLGRKTARYIHEADFLVTKNFNELLDLDIQMLLNFNKVQFFDYLSAKFFTDAGLYLILADILFETGKYCSDKSKNKTYFQKALWLYEENAKSTKIFSVSIQHKISHIQNSLKINK